MSIWETYRAAAAAIGRFMLDSLIPTRQTRPADVVASNAVVRLFLVPTQSHVTSIGAPIASWISFNSLSISCSQKVANYCVQPISRRQSVVTKQIQKWRVNWWEMILMLKGYSLTSSFFDMRTTASAPNAFATDKRSLWVSATTTRRLPKALAQRRVTSPIAPPPMTNTRVAGPTLLRLQVWTATLRGSHIAPSSSVTFSGSLKHIPAGCTTCFRPPIQTTTIKPVLWLCLVGCWLRDQYTWKTSVCSMLFRLINLSRIFFVEEFNTSMQSILLIWLPKGKLLMGTSISMPVLWERERESLKLYTCLASAPWTGGVAKNFISGHKL